MLAICCFMIGCGNSEQQGNSFSIHVQETENGKVEVLSSAKEGENVTVTVQPDAGFYLERFSVNEESKLDEVENNVYIIREISADISINAVFEQCETCITYADKKPKIDGEIDECWENVSKQNIERTPEYEGVHEASKPQGISTGYIKLMWDEDNLYLLSEINDVDVTPYDRLNLWFSETYLENTCKSTASDYLSQNGGISYSSKVSDGKYYSIVNPYGQQLLCENPTTGVKPIDFANKVKGYECKCTVTDTGYIVEMKIPKQSEAVYEEGHAIGLDVSIDTYYTGQEERHSYACLYGKGKYWTYADHLEMAPLIK